MRLRIFTEPQQGAHYSDLAALARDTPGFSSGNFVCNSKSPHPCTFADIEATYPNAGLAHAAHFPQHQMAGIAVQFLVRKHDGSYGLKAHWGNAR